MARIRSGWPEVLTRLFLVPNHEPDGEMVPVSLQITTGVQCVTAFYWKDGKLACS